MKEVFVCLKCGYEVLADHIGEMDEDVMDRFLDHLVECGVIERRGEN